MLGSEKDLFLPHFCDVFVPKVIRILLPLPHRRELLLAPVFSFQPPSRGGEGIWLTDWRVLIIISVGELSLP